MYTSIQLAALFGVTDQTIRSRSNEFTGYLSSSANPTEGETRQYNDEDVRVLTLIHEMKKAGARFRDIHNALKSGKRGDLPDMAAPSELAADGSKSALIKQLDIIQTALTSALEDGLRKDGKIELLTAQAIELQAKVDRLVGENAVLKAGQKRE